MVTAGPVPVEYAEAGIPLFWRYVEYGSVPLDALLAGDVPSLI